MEYYDNVELGYIKSRNRKLILLSLFEKWNPIALGCHWDNGNFDCPLCNEYIDSDCIGCPIWEKTNQKRCNGTPYIEFTHADTWSLGRHFHIEDEIEFLIALLDEKTQENLENIFIKWCKTNFID